MWTSSTTDSYNTITAHYLDIDSGNLKSRILDCSKFENTHASKHLEAELRRVTEKFNIHEKLVVGVSDNAANIKKALHDFGKIGIGCMAHSLNLIIVAAIKDMPELIELQKKVSRTVTLTRQSCNAKRFFMDCQKELGFEGTYV